ncbi:MAG: carbohydrate binding family 9 domain-containing protein [Cytophagales bacterium]|nr:carbohydrate binding family 9 domain-containing protein [Cytophagales bacterium]
MRRECFLICLFLLLNFYYAGAQKINSGYVIRIREAVDPVKVDGTLDELTWESADAAGNFHMVLPMDTSKAVARTEVKMTYDKNAFYLAAICYDDLPGGYVVESLKRDFSFGGNDNFLVFIDPFDDQTNGFTFGANAAGAQWDGMMFNGSSVNLNWDNKWTSKVKNYEDKWIFECRVPFKTMRYKEGITEWGINFSRLDLKLNEKSAWAPVPRQFPTAALAYTGILKWDNPPPKPGTNVSLIPYGLTRYIRDHEERGDDVVNWDIGVDAKISVTPSLNLDLTVNPDFSQVEVDRQVTNLSRFELFFPERRQFFLENSDLFASFGMDDIRPFFSRRIGLEAPIMFGARLSGKLNKNWRIGLMDIQTNKVDSVGLPVQNYAVVALQRQVFARSNIAAMFINKESLNYNPSPEDSNAFSLYNRNLGLEYNLASSDNIWTGKLMYHRSFSPGASGDEYTHASEIVYSTRKLEVEWHHEYVGKYYTAEVGYVPRGNYYSLNPRIRYNFFPKRSGSVVSHGPRLGSNIYFDGNFKRTDTETFLSYNIDFLNRSSFTGWVSDDYVLLIDDFDPTNTGGEKLEAGSAYGWNAFGLIYESTPKKLLTYEFSSRYGGYYNGTRLFLSGSVGYRFQPYVSLGADVAFNSIVLPEPYTSTDLWLVSPRLDVTFTNTLFLTTFMQYNNQADNININSRFQWRFQPASDFFIVYTENYLPEQLDVKNRALVLKLTYWYNI